MPANLYQIRTALGLFDSVNLAAAAHGVSRSTIMLWTRQDPENFQRIVRPEPQPARPAPAAMKRKIQARTGHAWPMPWSEYRWLGYDDQEEIYQIWCAQHDLEPESESTANAFYDEMDAAPHDTAE